jgi:LysR family glycine cleavage system transcriptional activator
MQAPHRTSLNAVRVFTVAASLRSIALAAEELSVTAGAVSHQIRRLEAEFGVRLFLRGKNSIDLTEEGRRFLDDCAPAITMIERSIDRLRRDTNEIVIRVSMSFGVRWLIPALESFKTLHPGARVRIETSSGAKATLGDSADIAIYYQRAGSDDGPGMTIATDLSQAVLSPTLLRTSGYLDTGRLGDVPALKCARANWDWKLWAERSGVPEKEIAITHEFDTDDAAIRAAAAGLGMVLSPTLLIAGEMQAGILVPLPGFAPAELGCYRLIMHPQPTRMARDFGDWLRDEMWASGTEAS